jgi:hypothetical protein
MRLLLDTHTLDLGGGGSLTDSARSDGNHGEP